MCVIESTETVVLPRDIHLVLKRPNVTVTIFDTCPTCRKVCGTRTAGTIIVYGTLATAPDMLAKIPRSDLAQSPSWTHPNKTSYEPATATTHCTRTLLVDGGFTHGPARTIH